MCSVHLKKNRIGQCASSRVSILLGLLVLIPSLFGCVREVEQISETPEQTEEPRTAQEIVTDVLKAYPQSFKNTALDAIEEFSPLAIQLAQQGPPSLRFIDKSNPLPLDYTPKHLVKLKDVPSLHISRDTLEGTPEAVDALTSMSNAMDKEGITLLVSSAYRTIAYQNWLYERSLSLYGFTETAMSVAPPGSSEHHLGTVFDFGDITPAFADTPASAWLVENAHNYGFLITYPEASSWLTGYMYEPWHYRFVGIEAAQFAHTYFDGVAWYTLKFLTELSEHSIIHSATP